MQMGHSHPVAFGCSLCANAAQFSLFSVLHPLFFSITLSFAIPVSLFQLYFCCARLCPLAVCLSACCCCLCCLLSVYWVYCI